MSGLDTILRALQQVLPSFAKSDGSIEAKMIDVVGTYADSEAAERANTLTTIQKALATQKVTTVNYYRQKAAEFQYGNELQYDPVNQGGYYDPVIPENRIVKQAFIVGTFPNFVLLVNAVGEGGHLRRLNDAELASFKSYFQAFQPIGLNIAINSFTVSQIHDDNIAIYIRKGSDAATVLANVKKNLIDYEATLRPHNTVSLTEIVDVIQREPGVVSVGFSNPYAVETSIDGVSRNVTPVLGVFDLLNGAFTFATELTLANIKTFE